MSTYILSGIGYYTWFHYTEAAAMIVILAPFAGYIIIKNFLNQQDKICFKKFSLKGIFIAMLIPIVYVVTTVYLAFLFKRVSFTGILLEPGVVVSLIAQWVFAGFCEEVGWRGFLFPMLKKIMKKNIACIVCGLIWGIWHIPMIVHGMMVTQHGPLLAIVFFGIEAISITFIMGSISEYKIGESVWTFIFLHASHNIVLQVFMPMISKEGQYLIDDGGYLLVCIIIITAMFVWNFRKVKNFIIKL